jgi:hypothetical protein
MRTSLRVACLLALLPQWVAAAPSTIECPAIAPPEWGLSAAATLSDVEVLSVPQGVKIDEEAPPSLVPDTSDVYDHALHQSWMMDQDGPGWSSFVDCHYRGTARILRLDAAGVKRCDRVIQPFDPRRPDNAASHESMICR